MKLYVESRTGWKLGGELQADLARSPVEISGGLDLWNLPIDRVLTQMPGIEIARTAHIDHRIDFKGPLDRLRVEVTTNVKGMDFADRRLQLEARGVTLGLKKVGYFDIVGMLRGLLAEEGDAEGDAEGDEEGGRKGTTDEHR